VLHNAPCFGAIMAGGRNTRYGAAKALERVGGTRIIDRVISALREVTPDVILIANDREAYAAVPLPTRPDDEPGAGALSGLLTALRWAIAEQRPGIIAVACDMPFVSAGLLARLLQSAADARVDVVAPQSGGRRGLEPLCAFYRTTCVPAIERALQRADFRMISFHEDVRVHALPIEEVRRFGDPAVLFMNVNTREERDHADQIAAANQ
jgi:molybdopterin-guanine dinucleotide biosynthesis protein A